MAANEAVDVTRDTAQRELRAYVGIEKIGKSHAEWRGQRLYRATVTLKNFGQTPAADVRINAGAETLPYPDKDEYFDWVDEHAQGAGLLNPGSSLEYKIDTIDPYAEAQNMPENAFYAFGEITYRDVFGNDRCTRFRYMLAGFPKGDALLTPCADGNEAN